MKYKNILALCVFTLGFSLSALSGCSSTQDKPDLSQYTLARAAIEAAKSVDAAKYSPGFMSQAEEAYKKALVLFKKDEYSAADEFFAKARVAAEKAENSARLSRFKSGEVL